MFLVMLASLAAAVKLLWLPVFFPLSSFSGAFKDTVLATVTYRLDKEKEVGLMDRAN